MNGQAALMSEIANGRESPSLPQNLNGWAPPSLSQSIKGQQPQPRSARAGNRPAVLGGETRQVPTLNLQSTSGSDHGTPVGSPTVPKLASNYSPEGDCV